MAGLWQTVGLAIDMASGFFFLALGLFVALQQPRTKLGYWFGWLAIGLALRALLDNAARLHWIPGVTSFEGVHWWFLIGTSPIVIAGLVGMVRSTVGIRRPALLTSVAIALLAVTWLVRRAELSSDLRALTSALALVMIMTMWWAAFELNRAPGMKLIVTALAAYSAANSLMGVSWLVISALQVDTMTAVSVTLRWFTPAVATLAAIPIFAASGNRGNVLAIVTVGVASLLWTLWLGETARDSGFLGLTRIVAVAIIGYAVVRDRAFDIDIKLRFTLRQSTIIVIGVGIFAAIETALSEYVADSWGILPGAIAAGTVVVAFSPLQKLADRLSEAALPNATQLDERTVAERKLMYEKLSRAAWSDGMLSKKDLTVLEAAREQLGLSVAVAGRIDREVRI